MPSGLTDRRRRVALGLRGLDVLGLRRLLIPHEVRHRVARDVGVGRVDMDAARAFAMGRSGEGRIYFLQDGDTAGASGLAEQLREELLAVEDPKTGRHVVEAVWSRSELLRGAGCT